MSRGAQVQQSNYAAVLRLWPNKSLQRTWQFLRFSRHPHLANEDVEHAQTRT